MSLLRLRVFQRLTGLLLWVLMLFILAAATNVLGIYLIGSLAGWERWMVSATGYFLAWRLCLYGTTAYSWLWMRRRLLAREPGTAARHRLIRAEIAAVLAIVVLEAGLLAQT